MLIGHSDSAEIAILYAAGNGTPSTLSLALMTPHVFVEDVSIERVQNARIAFEKGSLGEKLVKHHDDVEGAFWGWHDS